MKNYVIGVDCGTDSTRAIIIEAATGDELSSSVKSYSRWMNGEYCNPSNDKYRQHPLDYIEAVEFVIKDALNKVNKSIADNIIGISFTTTGSTPVMVNDKGVPLALLSGFEDNPNAMFILWKDHTSIKEANEINNLAQKWSMVHPIHSTSGSIGTGDDYLKYMGGIYSSEMVWSKVLHVLRTDKEIEQAAYSWIELCDWIPALLTGNLQPEKVRRSRCAAGHKALWHSDWGGLPTQGFFSALDSSLELYRERFSDNTFTSDQSAGYLSKEWAKRLGLNTNVVVGISALDCHMGAVGGEISPNVLACSIGTSTCDIMIASYDEIGDKSIAGICGQVDGSVVPGYIGLEAGQSAFGDIYAWFRRVLSWPLERIISESDLIDSTTKAKLIDETLCKIIPELSNEAMKLSTDDSSIIALDWMNGRRTPDANQELCGAITGLKLSSSAPLIFKGLVEATAFGAKAILERFQDEGIIINEIIGMGGVAQKSPFVMQTLADVLNMPIKITTTEHTCAFGAAMFAAVVSGIYPNVENAQKSMGKGFKTIYYPAHEKVLEYENLYKKYKKLGVFIEKEL